jgi:hypothetical protein
MTIHTEKKVVEFNDHISYLTSGIFLINKTNNFVRYSLSFVTK